MPYNCWRHLVMPVRKWKDNLRTSTRNLHRIHSFQTQLQQQLSYKHTPAHRWTYTQVEANECLCSVYGCQYVHACMSVYLYMRVCVNVSVCNVHWQKFMWITFVKFCQLTVHGFKAMKIFCKKLNFYVEMNLMIFDAFSNSL